MKQKPRKPLTTVIVGMPGAGASCLFMMLDVLSSVGSAWQFLRGEEPQPPRFLPQILSLDGTPFLAPNDALVTPQGKLADCRRPDLVLVPDIHIDPGAPLPPAYDSVAAWVAAAYRTGAIVASVCSGTLILAKAGLLDGAEATTHWGYCEALARQFPKVTVRGDRVLVPARPGDRVITSGGASAWNDLLLYLIARLAGPEEALRIAKLFLLQWHDQGQLPFAAFSTGRQHDDAPVARCQLWIADHYREENPVAAMAAQCGLNERSFHRRFRKATGLAPLAYVQKLRIEEAKHLLETTTIPIDDIAAEVGYVEPASFRRLFRRTVGIVPSEYRRRFQPLFELARAA